MSVLRFLFGEDFVSTSGTSTGAESITVMTNKLQTPEEKR
jgi:hypothetical protein